ncbi:MAG TPA: GtrA family protein [Stellaceae bacterium]|nr:GtrA family protein [Stellaceae bacterium]
MPTEPISPVDGLKISPVVGQFVRFGCVGTITFLIDAAVLTAVLAAAPGHFYLGRVLSYLVAASAGWWLNRRFTFGSEDSRWRQWLRYLAANLSGGLANYAVYAALIALVPFCRTQPALAVAAGAIAGLVFNFAASRRFVFNHD